MAISTRLQRAQRGQSRIKGFAMLHFTNLARLLGLPVGSKRKKKSRRPGPASDRWKARLSFETLEIREVMSAVPITFTVPTDVQAKGVYAAIFAKEGTGNNSNFYYYNNTSGGYSQITNSATASTLTFQLTFTGNQAIINLDDRDVAAGQIVIGVGSMPNVSFTAGATPASSGFTTPTAATSPDQYFGLFEYSVSGGDWNIDVSFVDQIGFPFTVTSTPAPAAPANNGVGITQNRGDLFNLYGEYIDSLGSEAAPYLESLTAGDGYRILAPPNLLDLTLAPSFNSATQQIGGSLTPNTTYYYWVTAVNAHGESFAGNTSVVTSPISTKNGNVNRQSVNLAWNAVENATGYRIYRSTQTGSSTATLVGTTNSPTALTYYDKGLYSVPGTPPRNAYSYQPLNSYFNVDLNSFFAHYKWNGTVQNSNKFSISANFNGTYSTFSGYVYDNYQDNGTGPTYTVLKLTSPDYKDSSNNDVEFVTFAPYFYENTTSATAPLAPTWMPNTNLSPGAMILACDGAFNSLDPFTAFSPSASQLGEWQTVLAGVQNSIVSAFNRGIATNFAVAPNDWANPPLVTGAKLLKSSGGHGSLTPNTTYYYVVTGLTPTGETTISREVSATVVSGYQRVQLSWTPQDTPAHNPVGYSGYRIYRSTTPGSGYQRIDWPITNHHASNLTGFIDNGNMPMVAGTPPMYYQTGTAANWYAAFVHLNGSTNPISGVSLAGLGYGFAYDDQGNNSSDFTAYSPTGISINLLSWKNRTTVPTQPTTNPLPAPPTTPNSLYFYRQPANTKVNASNSVAFKAFTSADYTYFGGAKLLVTLVGANNQQTPLGTVTTDPLSGLGIVPFKSPSKAGSYFLLFSATDNSGKTYQTNPFQVTPASAR